MKGNKSKNKIKKLCYASLIAAIYVALTYLSSLMGVASGAVQVRISDALCVLPVFFPEATPGLFIGCLLANLLTGAAPFDIIFGALATLLGGFGAYAIGRVIERKHVKSFLFKCLVPVPTILANTIVIPLVIYFCYTQPSERSITSIPFFAATVFAGEVISAGILGMLLYLAADKNKRFLIK